MRSQLWGFGAIKATAARTNEKLGLLESARSTAIRAASLEVMDGLLDEHFVVDRIQGGAGTSTNLNVNEIVANRGLELVGETKGDYAAPHPAA
ncbi:aspartate ammonia-lyase [Arthrobacter pigmenti]|uniref:Aspartate ammonia-lyase n=2 Tax=Arthrobacter pigmenti TaxID=271432 RepID=A0A846RK89_9MICC|nr:aspartate ammonia-lyase [Arthrobacter pigmenti]